MHRIPRDLSGSELSRLLEGIGYKTMRQRGSHIRLEAVHPRKTHGLTVPNHDSIKIGTLNSILADVAEAMGVEKAELSRRLFDR